MPLNVTSTDIASQMRSFSDARPEAVSAVKHPAGTSFFDRLRGIAPAEGGGGSKFKFLELLRARIAEQIETETNGFVDVVESGTVEGALLDRLTQNPNGAVQAVVNDYLRDGDVSEERASSGFLQSLEAQMRDTLSEFLLGDGVTDSGMEGVAVQDGVSELLPDIQRTQQAIAVMGQVAADVRTQAISARQSSKTAESNFLQDTRRVIQNVTGDLHADLLDLRAEFEARVAARAEAVSGSDPLSRS